MFIDYGTPLPVVAVRRRIVMRWLKALRSAYMLDHQGMPAPLSAMVVGVDQYNVLKAK